jgi:DNA-binding transcriptional LysR family regulator
MGPAIDLAVEAVVAGTGIVYLFEDWIAPRLANGELEPVLPDWWPSFPARSFILGRRLMPWPLRLYRLHSGAAVVLRPLEDAELPIRRLD